MGLPRISWLECCRESLKQRDVYSRVLVKKLFQKDESAGAQLTMTVPNCSAVEVIKTFIETHVTSPLAPRKYLIRYASEAQAATTVHNATENTTISLIFLSQSNCKPTIMGNGSTNIAQSIATLKTPVATTVVVTNLLEDVWSKSIEAQSLPGRGAQKAIQMAILAR